VLFEIYEEVEIYSRPLNCNIIICHYINIVGGECVVGGYKNE
jgi:hypothetical protein